MAEKDGSNKKMPKLLPFAGGMKFATQISPLLNFMYSHQIFVTILQKASYEELIVWRIDQCSLLLQASFEVLQTV